MKKPIWLLVAILLLTNVSTIVYYQTRESSAEPHYFLQLSGVSEHWQMKGYEVAATPFGSERGGATITYRGHDPQVVREGIVVEFYDGQSHEPYHITGDRALNEQQSFTTGGSGGNTSPSKGTLPIAELEKTFAKIKWQTTDGQSHAEDIALYIDSPFRHLLEERNPQ